jgi:hypothetical protein
MLLTLFRQLVSAPSSSAPSSTCSACGTTRVHHAPRVDDAEWTRLKREIWELGSSRLGDCFSYHHEDDERDAGRTESRAERWRRKTRAVTLQLAARAEELRRRAQACPCSPAAEGGEGASGPPPAPSAATVRFAESWAETNIRRGTRLAGMMRDRVRNAVFEAVVGSMMDGSVSGAQAHSDAGAQAATAAGLDPLAKEIRHLADKVGRLAAVHLNVYGRGYEQDGFLPS